MLNQLIIFDLDGTLLNTISDLGEACNYALAKVDLPTHATEEYPNLVGNGINKLIERALPADCKQTDALCNEWIRKVRESFVPYYNAHNCVLTRPYEGITELLQHLKNKGCLLAVASNKYQEATEQIVQHFFPNTFDVVLGERPNIPRKPDPQIVFDILASLPTTPYPLHATLYIGDSLVDIQTAHNAHLPIAACSWGFVPKEQLVAAEPDYLVDKPDQILSLVAPK